ncbi:MAG: phosphonate metabolism protein/1,5-bisphosphokinase (PRPP-forming) PhnN [Candidatus Lokiarchaeota archaeon]|nr:phosphonate metabolism protein/1,5-bisphosphokinase (PRPP-forming) PhnN [Candidatus Lokiarchaeota archaeon]MBD3337997.1 phosphonate metabolism protein/1,5-bisphosphokinase (PRPP-forming) PhnN [Candidatus Lokiarchaeota archaeon]
MNFHSYSLIKYNLVRFINKKDYPGTLFLVIGNSGSGKDSIIAKVIKNYPSNLKTVYAVRRYITRPPSETEKNISVTDEEYEKMIFENKFALYWHSYGLDYGVPIEVEDWLKNGHPVLVNVSRTIVHTAREKYKNVKVVFVEVPFDKTVERIKKRGRETGVLLRERIERARKNQTFPTADFVVDNSGDLEDAVEQFLDYVIEIVTRDKN